MNSSKSYPPYEQTQLFSSELGGQQLQFQSKPGIPNWNLISPTSALIAAHLPGDSGNPTLYLGCSHGAGAAALALKSPHSEIWCSDINIIALEMTTATMKLNQIENAKIYSAINLTDSEKELFASVIIDLPKSRRLTQRWLVQAWEATQPGGVLYLAGANDHGIQSALKDAQALWGQPAILGYKKGCRIARFRKSPSPGNRPDWSIQPGIAPGTWYNLDIFIKDYHLDLVSLPGIFSYDRLDMGTQVLLESIELQRGARILDLGCGFGLIGIFTGLAGALSVDLVDSNLLSVAAAQENVQRCLLINATVLASDALASVHDCCYDIILSNPPFHSGQVVDYQMAEAFIQQSFQSLVPGGQFIIVANQFIRYEIFMKPFFTAVKLLRHSAGYQVWVGEK